MGIAVGERKQGREGSWLDRTSVTYPALASPEYRNLLLSGMFVFFAVQGQQIVRGLLALDLKGSSSGLGAVFLAFGVPQLALTPFAGPIADRVPKRIVLLISQTMMLGSALWVGFADAFDFLSFNILLGGAAIQGASFSLYGPARMSFTSSLVDREALPNAVVLGQLTFNATRVIGPAAAGALVGVHAIGTAGVYLGTAALLLAAWLITWRLPIVPVTSDQTEGVFAGIASGVRYVRSLPRVGLLILVSAMVTMAGMPYMAFLPKMAKDVLHGGGSGYAIMSAVSAVAAVLLSMWQARQPERESDWRTQTVLGFSFVGGLVLLAVAPNFGFGLFAIAVVGASTAGFQTLNNALVLTNTDSDYHGRVQSMMMLSFSAFFIISYPMGVLADAIGLRATHLLMAGVCGTSLTLYSLARRRIVTSAVAAGGAEVS
ncbi:MAG: MFS transporter [Acidimicrobiia bacterium]